MPALGNVMLLALIVWMLFAILGLHLFCGCFYSCMSYDAAAQVYGIGYSYHTQAECTGTYVDEHTNVVMTRVWKNADFNFDNIFNALYTMFVIATLDDWQHVMWQAIDSPMKAGGPPIKDNNI